MKILIKNGTIVTEKETRQADLLAENGIIRSIGNNLPSEGASVLDATGKLVLPGGVDAHTHITLNLEAARGTDTYYTGTIPAATGGTTTILDHLCFMPAGRKLAEHIAAYRILASGESVVDYMFHGLAQGAGSIFSAALGKLPEGGFSSLKAYMTYADYIDGNELLHLLNRSRDLGLLLALHAEDDATIYKLRTQFRSEGKGDPIWHAASRPVESEATAVERALHLAAKAGDAPIYIVHLSSAAGLEAVRKARAAGQKNIHVETCIQYLCLTDELYKNPVQGLRAVISPPLRTPADIEALWEGIRNREIEVVASDHCPFSQQEKMAGLHDFTRCPNGAPGLEERFAVFYSEGVAKGRISLERFVECVSTAPARLFGLYPRKGTLAPGSDADIVVLDPKAEYTLQTADLHGPGDFSLYDGMRLQGRIDSVFLHGRKIAEGGSFTGGRGMGELLRPDAASAKQEFYRN